MTQAEETQARYGKVQVCCVLEMGWRWRMGGIVGGYIRRNNRALLCSSSSSIPGPSSAAGPPLLVVSSAGCFVWACAF